MRQREPDNDPVAERQSQATDTGPHTLHMEGWISCAPFERLLNMEIVSAGDGAATLKMPFLVQFAQGAALMHGGALMSLADTALVMAIKSRLPPYTNFVTVHAEVDYLRPVRQGVVTAQARVTNVDGRKIGGESLVFDAAGEKVLAFAAQFVIPRQDRIEGVTFADAGD